MNQKEAIKKLWTEVFHDSKEYVDMYFDRVYRDTDALTVVSDGKLESSMLLQSYRFLFQQTDVGMGYIAGAMTRRSSRGKGLMAGLIKESFAKAYERGDMLVSLIPSHDWLYFYYDRFGFSTVFYVDTQRFTSLHQFPTEGSYTPVEDIYSDKVYEAFERMERERHCTVLHSHRDFLNIMDDNRADGGRFVAMADADGKIVSMAWAIVNQNMVTVTELLGTDHDAREAACHQLRKLLPDKAFKVLAPPLAEHRRLNDRGMARIINADLCLQITAKNNPGWHSRIRITDPLIAANNQVWEIADGQASIITETYYTHNDTDRPHLDFDVPINVFNEIVFSSQKIGDVLGFPSQRPVMSLMLD